MFKEIFVFEMKLWLKRPAIYIYFLIFFALSFLLGAAVSGMLSGVSTDTNTWMNSAALISEILTSFSSDYLMGLITIMICVALMAGSVQKDFQHNCFSFYFTKPISKFSYLTGRFIATFLLTVLVLTAVLIGLWTAYMIAPNDNGQIGPFRFINFFEPFVLFLIPNVLLIGTIFFCLVTFTRNMTSGYVGGLLFIVVGGIARSITRDIDNKTLSALLDPFGQQALELLTEYWTPAESNSRLIPLSGYVLYNRMLWLGISFALLLFTYRRFSFNQFLSPVSLFSRKAKERRSQPSRLIQSIAHLPKATQEFGGRMFWQQLGFLTKFEFRKIVRSVFFYVILALGILLTVVTSQFSGVIFGTKTYPVTYQQIELSSGTFRFFLLIMIVFYSGIIIWRERDHKVDELVGAAPVSNAAIFLSKLSALVLMCLTVYMVNIVTCVFIQAYQGYYNFELGLYFNQLIFLRLFSVVSLAALALALQVFFRNRYLGYFAMIVIIIALPIAYNAFKYKNYLATFDSSGDQLGYSDMNGMGHTLPGFFIYKLYWLGFVIIAGIVAMAMYQRGKEGGLKLRWRQAKKHFGLSYKLATLLGVICFFGCGAVIYYNTRVLTPYKSAKEREVQRIEFEKSYSKYAGEPQPRVVESNLKVDIYPEEQAYAVSGYYYLKNKTQKAVKNIFINWDPEARQSYTLQVKYQEFLNDTLNGFMGLQLAEPLQPGDSLQLAFSIRKFPSAFIIKKANSEVVENGSFFNSGVLPSIGYSKDSEINDNTTRKKYNLPVKPRMAAITDSTAYGNNYISSDADWIRFECIVTTREGQIAIAPGYLQREWTETDPKSGQARRAFHYKMDAPILNFYAFLSASYEVKKDLWTDPLNPDKKVNIEIYYHKGHEYNLDRMIRGIKKSLDYFTRNFSPYQHRQVRIIEFPRYDSFAQSFPNTIPFSESIGFIAKVDETDVNEVDYPFYVTSHEVAHQWWAHQVMGANVQGSTVMSETMSQYSALMVMEKEYGAAAMRKFLKYEMDTYLQGRTAEKKKELPLLLCENQQYIHYNKGSVVMYALKDYIGEDTLNAALRRYIRKVAFQEPPYTTALEFYSYIKAATPDSLKETLADMFERIVVFDNKMKTWSAEKTADGKYRITGTISCVKTRSDSLGKAKEVTPSDWVDLAVFEKHEKNSSALGNIIWQKKIKVNAKEQQFEIIVDKEPYMVGIDPMNKLIDKAPGNNTSDKNGKSIGGDAEGSAVVISSSE